MRTSRDVMRASVALMVMTQAGCSDDGPSWAFSDAGVDGAVVADSSSNLDGGTNSTDVRSSTEGSSDTASIDVSFETRSTESSDMIGSGELDSGTSDAVTSETITSGASSSDLSSSSSPLGETSTTEVTSESSSSTSESSTGSTEVTSESSTGSTEVTSESSTGSTEGEGSASCDGGTCGVSTTDEPDSGTPGLTICDVAIDESKGIALESVLPGYLESQGSDGGASAATDCYPPCIAALLAQCPVTNECTWAAGSDDACWSNGLAQKTLIDESSDAFTVTQTAFLQDAPCIQGAAVLDWGTFSSTYTWWDGTGAVVAQGTDESGDLVVTCEYDEQEYTVDVSACPWLGDVVYARFDCSL